MRARSFNTNGSYTATARRTGSSPRYGFGRKTRTAVKTKSRQRSKRKSLSWITIIFLSLFIMFMLVLAQNLVLIKWDNQLNALQTEYNDLKAQNDGKEGKIMSSCNYDTIVPAAKNLGMQEVTSDQNIVISVTKQNRNFKDFDSPIWYN